MKKLMMILAAVMMVSVVAQADVMWGCTNGTNDVGFWSGGEIFTVNTNNGSVDVKAKYSNHDAFGDIAVNGNGNVYVTMNNYNGVSDFKTLAKVNTTDWSFDWTMTLGVQVNSLTFVGDTLYLHAGGGGVDGLYKIAGSDLNGTNAPTFIANSGYVGSDGDLFYNSSTDKMYNVFTPGSVGNLAEIDYANGGATLVGTLNGTAKFGTTSGGFDFGWAGMEFDSNGKLWAGTYWDQNLYSRPGLLAGQDVSVEYDLSSDLGGTITGLSYVPEPATMCLLGLGGLGLLRRKRA